MSQEWNAAIIEKNELNTNTRSNDDGTVDLDAVLTISMNISPGTPLIAPFSFILKALKYFQRKQKQTKYQSIQNNDLTESGVFV